MWLTVVCGVVLPVLSSAYCIEDATVHVLIEKLLCASFCVMTFLTACCAGCRFESCGNRLRNSTHL